MPSPSDDLIRQTQLMLSSYRYWKKEDLWPLLQKSGRQLAEEVFEAPFVLCSAGTEKDPILNYGNRKALELWEMPWEIFTQTPGRHTAEPAERSQREHFLKTVQTQGYIDNYSGIRVSSSGKRFEIKQATVWNLIDENGAYAGQAAAFNLWKFLRD